ncbi:hypothetical protein CFP65_0464 [Kitasatospora sp. MMS16-BH015]|uniref:hypothetical protein n=1 Tax=Kitasatospora sp. MMS16-BH015 TaxID=2018025 RepID=UPI000CA101E1|nr:hypothetical protein [Kitasatospora sp. MMS16-BH015]AUG75427.1 hypothetical protein CFP65_0464 [Kitasatospora sp. MMS16-BH015]
MTNEHTDPRVPFGGFDFFLGEWKVANRRLTDFLDPASGWTEFPGLSRCRRLLDGLGNTDEIDFPTLGVKGMTLRLFDPEAGEWSLYWSSTRTGRLEPPVRGRFTESAAGLVGEFTGEDEYAGRPVLVRYRWDGISATTARWQQAFSADGGQSWVTNWSMEFTRR